MMYARVGPIHHANYLNNQMFMYYYLQYLNFPIYLHRDNVAFRNLRQLGS